MKKKTSAIAVLTTLLFVTAIALFVPLGQANPYWWYKKVPPDSSTEPPVISVVSPENNTVYTEDNVLLSFDVVTGKSKTADDTLLFSVEYTTDWKHNNTDRFAPWSRNSFTHEVNLTKIPEGTHIINITTTEMGTYTKTGPNAFLIDSYKTIVFTINPNAETDQIPEFPSWTVFPMFLTATLVVTLWKKKLSRPAS